MGRTKGDTQGTPKRLTRRSTSTQNPSGGSEVGDVKVDPSGPSFDFVKDLEQRKKNLERVYKKGVKQENPPKLQDLPRLPFLPQVEVEGLGRMLQLESKVRVERDR